MTTRLITARPGISLERRQGNPAGPSDREAAAGRRSRAPARTDHRQGHGQGDAPSVLRARIRWGGCASARRSASDPSARSAWRRCCARASTCCCIDTAHGHSRNVIDALQRDQARVPRRRSGRGQRRDRRGRQGADRRGRRRAAGRDGPRLDLHHARGFGRRRAADHRDHGLRRDRRAAQHPDHRGRRHPFLRRYHQGAGGGRLDA